MIAIRRVHVVCPSQEAVIARMQRGLSSKLHMKRTIREQETQCLRVQATINGLRQASALRTSSVLTLSALE